jgi:hypothetical protein
MLFTRETPVHWLGYPNPSLFLCKDALCFRKTFIIYLGKYFKFLMLKYIWEMSKRGSKKKGVYIMAGIEC